MSQDKDESPLVRPRPQVKRLNGFVLILGAGVLILLSLVVLHGIFTAHPATQAQDAKQEAIQAPENKPLTALPEGSGLAVAPPKPAEKEKDAPPLSFQRNPLPLTTVVSPQAQAVMAEREQVRRLKMQLELQALQAPLSVSLSDSASRASGRTVSAPVSAPRPDRQTRATNALPGKEDADAERKDKERFLEARSLPADPIWRLPHVRQAGMPCEIKTGTVIPGIMITGINSDLPGKLIAQVSQNVYDTATGSMLVIPQGSWLFGTYDARVAMGQNRVLIAWNRIIFPDGSAVTLDSMPGADQAGYSGFEDQIDNHYLKIFGSAVIMSLISGGMAYSVDALDSTSSDNDNPSLRDEMGTALAAQLGQASLQLLQQNINIKPTLEVRPGYRFNLVLVKDLVLDKPYTPSR